MKKANFILLSLLLLPISSVLADKGPPIPEQTEELDSFGGVGDLVSMDFFLALAVPFIIIVIIIGILKGIMETTRK